MAASANRVSKTLALAATALAAFVCCAGREVSSAWAQQPRPALGSSFDGYGGVFTGTAARPEEPLSLWYRRPAGFWAEALPVGNGRLGAMVFCGITRERLQLNEDTLWAGGPYDPNNPEALTALPEARRLLSVGKYAEAHKLVGEKMVARPLKQKPYQTVGGLLLTFPEVDSVEGYRRDLNLDTAVASVTYTAGGVRFTREVFSSPLDQVIVVRLTADRPGRVTFTAAMRTPQKARVAAEEPDTLVLRGANGEARGAAGALKFQARVRVLAQGARVEAGSDTVSVRGVDSATILVDAATSYKSYKDVSGDPEAPTKNHIRAAARKSFDALRRDHVAEHRRLFRRVSLDLASTDAAGLPTDERNANFAVGRDPQLARASWRCLLHHITTGHRPPPGAVNGEKIGP